MSETEILELIDSELAWCQGHRDGSDYCRGFVEGLKQVKTLVQRANAATQSASDAPQ